MKPVLHDKTVLRLQKATGLPISRGMDKTINTLLDELEDLKTSNSAEKNEAHTTTEILDCICKVETVATENGKSQNDE